MQKVNQLINKLGWPGIVSLLSLLFTWLAITSLLSNQLKLSVIMAVIAFLLDSADGYIARKFKLESDFGRQLDGMIDSFNYSLLAALVVWKEVIPGTLGLIVGFLILAFGILRLIGFNQEGYVKLGNKLYYRGVVTCHMSLIAFIFLILDRFIALPDILVAIIISIFAILQLSNIKTLKTGALFYWIPVALIIGLIGLIWL